MSTRANVAIHASQFPDAVRRDLLESLRTRQVNHKFHYDSVKQTQKWLALHQAYSPSRYDLDCAKIYNEGFTAAAKRIQSKRVHVIGLGCGGGQKDTQLLWQLKKKKRVMSYSPCDVSTAMVLVARQTALKILPEQNCFPLVCDLVSANNLPKVFRQYSAPNTSRILTFFGMIPNFEPGVILPKLAALVRPADTLLFSANLAPGRDYASGVKTILPQYDNLLTRDWLMTFLLDSGFERTDGKLRFKIEARRDGLRRVAADFELSKSRKLKLNEEAFAFRAGERIRLFFSYRYTPELIRAALGKYGFQVLDQWITKSGEEGVFLCRRK